MTIKAELPLPILQPYTAAILMVLAALLMGFTDGPWHFAGGVFLALVSFLGARELLGKVRKANEQKSFLDEQLIQSQKLAAIGELSSGIAHEINNPLAIISQESEWANHLLQSDELRDHKQVNDLKDSLREITRQVERCKEITHRLLNFARKMETLMQRVDVNRLIEDMTKLVERETKQHNINIVRHFQKDLPPVVSDSPLLRQVMLNLLNNAAYAIQKDGAITLTTRLADQGQVEIIVADTGSGISKENLSKIFNPFFTTKPPGKGTGLGLSICHRIIDKLGGHISVTSELGHGTIFTIRLPLEQEKGEV
jgi:two-component system, NtrC family, sensor kinase